METLWIAGHKKKFVRPSGPKVVDQPLDVGVFARPFACGGVTLVRHSRRARRAIRRRTTLNVNVHCFEQHIAGRTYFIEVQAVTDSRWRAQLARLPGMSTAMMPFYGSTPEEAARELSRWLSLVYNGYTKQ